MPRTVRAWCITAEAVARERQRVGDDPGQMDVSRVIELDKIELPDLEKGIRTLEGYGYRFWFEPEPDGTVTATVTY